MEEPEGRNHPQNTHIDQQDTYFAVDSSSYFVFKSKSSAWVVSSAVKDRKKSVYPLQFSFKITVVEYLIVNSTF